MRAPSDKAFIHGGMYLLSNKMRLVGDMFMRDITTKQWLLLRVMQDFTEPASFTRIAREMNSTRQNVTKMLTLLEKQGQVTVRPSPNDGRTQEAMITEKGRAVLREIAVRGMEYVDQLLEGVSATDVLATKRTMQAMMANLENMQKYYKEQNNAEEN